MRDCSERPGYRAPGPDGRVAQSPPWMSRGSLLPEGFPGPAWILPKNKGAFSADF